MLPYFLVEKEWERGFFMFIRKRLLVTWIGIFLFWNFAIPVRAEVHVSAPSVILVEASTGQIIYQENATDRRSPASITKIMTLLITFEQLESGKISLTDEVCVSEYASSMGGSQVYLAQGEVQTLDTMLKCITISSANDASVAVAEHIAGSEEAFVDKMNEKAEQLGMKDTHFEDCCGLTESDNHFTSARDVAVMSRELITKYPKVFDYTQIWMEDITHVTKQGSSTFTLSSTNKLLKQYPYTTGLKTGSMSKAKFCVSATASKDGIDLIAVVMGAPDGKTRFADAKNLLVYGYSVCHLYVDEEPEALAPLLLRGGIEETVPIRYEEQFRYLDISGNSLEQVQKEFDLPEFVQAPVEEGATAGVVHYILSGKELGSVNIVYDATIPKAGYIDYLKKVVRSFWL